MAAPTSAPPGAQWFALHTLSGQEGKVRTYIEKFKKAEELDDSIFEILLPTEVVSEVKAGKKSTKVRKLYPGYVFIQMRLYGEDGKVDADRTAFHVPDGYAREVEPRRRWTAPSRPSRGLAVL